MQKVYERIVWVDFPSTKTALASRLLNQMDYAIDEIDNRVVKLSGYQEEALLSEQNSKESEIKAKISETNAKESEVKSKEYMEKAFAGTPEGYDDLVDRVNSPVIRQTTEETIVGCEDGGLKLLKVGGNSYQKVTSPKNKLNLNDVFSSGFGTFSESQWGIILTYVADEKFRLSHINVSGSANAPASGVETASIQIYGTFRTDSDLILSGCPVGGGEDTYYLKFETLEEPTEVYKDYGSGVVVPGGKTGRISFVAKVGLELDLILYPMLSKEGGAYEPYGLPYAPSPERKSDIANFGDCVGLISGMYADGTGLYSVNDSYCCSQFEIKCAEGENFELRTDVARSMAFVMYKNGKYYNTVTQAGDVMAFTIPSGVTSINFNIDCPLADVGRVRLTRTVGGITFYPLVIRTKSKNLAVLRKANSTSYELIENEDGTYTTISNASNDESGLRTPLTQRLKKGVYTLTNIQSNGKVRIRLGMESQNDIFADVGQSITFEYDGVGVVNFISHNVKAGQTTTYKIQLEEGSVATDFVPAKETQTIIWLPQPLRGIGGANDELVKRNGVWYGKRNTVRRSLKGLTWGSTNGVWHYTDKISDIALTKTTTDGAKMSEAFLCTHLPYKSDRSFIINGKELGITAWYGVDYSAYRLAVYPNMTLEEWKTFVEKTDVYIEYPLAEPVFEELSSSMQLKLNALETYADVTHIIIDSHIKTSGILSEYGTTKIASYTLKSLLNSESNKVLIEELSTAIIAVGSEE